MPKEEREVLLMRTWIGYEKGVNLGGWLSQCDYRKEHLEHFIEEEDIRRLSSWGLDHLRLPIDYNVIQDEQGQLIDSGFAHIQRAVDWCGRYGLNLILDLHKTAGYSFDKGEKEDGFFTSSRYQEYFYTLWEELARRYGGYGDRVAFELLNEVTDEHTMDAWNAISQNCIRRIRAIAPTTKILIGGYWNNCVLAVKALAAPVDDNIVYNFHCYEPLIFTHQGAYWVEGMPQDLKVAFDQTNVQIKKLTRRYLPDNAIMLESVPDTEKSLDSSLFESLFAEAVAVAEERNVPLYCGEYGVINRVDPQDTLRWYQSIHTVFEKYHIGHAAWCYKEMDFGIIDPHMDTVREKLLCIL